VARSSVRRRRTEVSTPSPETEGLGAAAAQNRNPSTPLLSSRSGKTARAMAAADVRQEKVRKYEEFVDRRLKPDLANAIAQRDKVFQQQKTL
jgi:hypothetical protein